MYRQTSVTFLRVILWSLAASVCPLLLAASAYADEGVESIVCRVTPGKNTGVGFAYLSGNIERVNVELTTRHSPTPSEPWNNTMADFAGPSTVIEKSGLTIWTLDNNGVTSQTWEGDGITNSNADNPGPTFIHYSTSALFEGQVRLSDPTGRRGDSGYPTFRTSLADIDIDMDSAGLYLDAGEGDHWSPAMFADDSDWKELDCYYEDWMEDLDPSSSYPLDQYGMFLPAGIVKARDLTSSFDVTTVPYKNLTLNVDPKWGGHPDLADARAMGT